MSSSSRGGAGSNNTGDEWDTWGPAAAVAAGNAKDNNKVKDEENELEKWLNDDTWDGGQSSLAAGAAAAKSSSSGTSTNSNKSSSSSSNSRTKSKSKSSSKKNIPQQPSEPAVVDNLIDFGAADVTTTSTAAGDAVAEGSGWEEETWATVDDGWESLELSGGGVKTTSQQ